MKAHAYLEKVAAVAGGTANVIHPTTDDMSSDFSDSEEELDATSSVNFTHISFIRWLVAKTFFLLSGGHARCRCARRRR